MGSVRNFEHERRLRRDTARAVWQSRESAWREYITGAPGECRGPELPGKPGMSARVAQRFDHLGRGYHLADVALGVVSDVNERAADAGGQLLAADEARGVEIG